MADFIHMDNLIQGEVLRIKERRPLDQQADLLEELYQFLGEQQHSVLMIKLKTQVEAEALAKPSNAAASQSAVEHDNR